jgi:putative endopeptidase
MKTFKLAIATSMLVMSAAMAHAAAPSAKPELGTFGFDEAGMDRTVAPGDSFYDFASGTWTKNNPIPADKSSYGMFNKLADLSEARTRTIIEAAAADKNAAPGSEAQKVGDFYRSFMDEAGIEAKGLTPLAEPMAKIAATTSVADVVKLMGAMGRRGGNSPIRVGVGQDSKNPEIYVVGIGQGGLGLGDRDLYDTSKKQFDPVRKAYKTYLTTLFTLAKFDHPEDRAASVYAFEEKIAAVHWTRVENRDPVKTYNPMSPDELTKLAPNFDWTAYFTALGTQGQSQYDVAQPSAIAKSVEIMNATPVAVLQDYMRAGALRGAAGALPKAFVDAQFEFSKVATGAPQLQARWKRGVAATQAVLGEAVGKLYVAKYFTPATKARADALVQNLLTSMGQRLDGLTWMSPETKALAKAKLATYAPKIGYPTKWRDYSALTIKPDDVVGNLLRASEFGYNHQLAKLGKPLDRTEWGMTPQTVNAYYNPQLNEMVFPAAILQPPFFDPNADDAVNYGGIGAVIGHEISHGFDDQGSQFDAKGALKNWWTGEDRTKFNALTGALAEQYNAYCPFPGPTPPKQCVNGKLTLGENIADLAGLTVAYQAYHLSLHGKPAPVIDGLTGDQRFFLGWAQVWRQTMREAMEQNLLVSDPHSPTRARASVVRNLDAWYAAFDVKPGQKLYLTPEQRIKIW